MVLRRISFCTGAFSYVYLSKHQKQQLNNVSSPFDKLYNHLMSAYSIVFAVQRNLKKADNIDHS